MGSLILMRNLSFAKKSNIQAITCVYASLFHGSYGKTMSTNICYRLRNSNVDCIITLNPRESMGKKQFRNSAFKVWHAKSNFSSKVKSEIKEASENVSFDDMMKFRLNQARHSLLIELSTKEDIPFITSLCKNSGGVKYFISYTGENGCEYFLVEFIKEETVHDLLTKCECKNISDVFPVYSRLIRYERKKSKKLFEAKSDGINTSTSVSRNCKFSYSTISQLMEEVFKTEKLSDLSTRLRFLFSTLLQEALSGMFPYSTVFPFGSSVNGFGRACCDLDVMIRLYPENVKLKSELCFQTKTCVGDIRVLQQRALSSISEIIRTFFPGITYVQRIQHARMPIIKFKHKILDLECDVSVNNMAAVCMSEILYFCGEIDPRVRPLIFTVKKWAKEANITYGTPGSWITNFSLTMITLFFLQNRPVPIIPPFNNALQILFSKEAYAIDGIEYLENISKWESSALQNVETLETLLKEFFYFLSSFSFKEKNISLLTGEANLRNDGYPICVQYPLEEHHNVSKNVSVHEMEHLCHTASVSLKHLERNLGSKSEDLMVVLGVPLLKEMYSNRIDISALYSETVQNVSRNKKS